MKRSAPLVVVAFLFFALVSVPLFSAEVSEEKDIALFGITAGGQSVPGDLLSYAESSISNEFITLKRFNVLGYENYRLESTDVEEFIERVKEIQAERAKEEGTYDEKFGTVVISGEDFDRIVGSVLVVIPSVADYRKTVVRIPVQTGDFVYWVRKHEVTVSIDLIFVNIKTGTREESLRVSGSSQNRVLQIAARDAVDNAVSNLALKLRKLDAFKIKSGVVRVQGDTVFFELGSAIGVKPGHEYEVMTKQELIGTDRIVEIPTGLVRVKNTYEDLSEANIVYQKERITEGDQLVEVARLGMGLSVYGGIMQVDVPDMDYPVYVADDVPVADEFYYIDFDQKERGYIPAFGLSFGWLLGYRFRGLADLQLVPAGKLWGFLGEFGAGAGIYKRRFTLQFEALGGFMYMTSIPQRMSRTAPRDSLIIEGTVIRFDRDPRMQVYGYSFGLKSGATLNFRMNKSSSLRLGVHYRLYTPIKDWYIVIEESSGDSVEIRSSSDNIVEYSNSEGLKRTSISGFDALLAVTLHF
jgi:hypothetical protein